MAGSKVSGGDTRVAASLFDDDDDEVPGRRRLLFPSPRNAATIDILSASHQRRWLRSLVYLQGKAREGLRAVGLWDCAACRKLSWPATESGYIERCIISRLGRHGSGPWQVLATKSYVSCNTSICI